jgi:hypothetical protein
MTRKEKEYGEDVIKRNGDYETIRSGEKIKEYMNNKDRSKLFLNFKS